MAYKNHSNYPQQYLKQIQTGKVAVSRKIRIAYEYFVEVLPENDSEWEYRDDLAIHAIDFIEDYCVASKGRAVPLELMLFQKAALSLMFGWVKKGTTIRKHRINHFIVARKNGKSTLASAIALYLLFADGEHGPEIYSVATKQDQAKIIWEESGKMIRKSPRLRQLGRTLHSNILSDINDGSFKALGRDSKTLDGLNPSGALMDEIEAWTDMNMYDVIIDGTAARDNWFILLTSTAGPVRESVWDNLYRDGELQINAYSKGEEIDERVLYLVYELDKKEEWKEPSKWIKANPALDVIKNVGDLERKVENAKRNPRLVNNLVMKDFNIPETDESSWLNLEDIINDTELRWVEDKGKFKVTDLIKSGGKVDAQSRYIKGRYGVGGFDLSETTDLTCASVLFQVEDDPRIYMQQMYWIPEELMEIREHEDNVPYRAWQQEGWLRTTAGNRIDYKEVAKWFIEVQEKLDIYLIHIGYDGWSASYLVDDMTSYFGEGAMEEVRQGTKTLSNPMKLMESDLKSKRLVYGRNPIFEWCVTNVRVKEDTNGNIQPTKVRGKNVRIDGFAAALDAYVALERNKENYTRMIGGLKMGFFDRLFKPQAQKEAEKVTEYLDTLTAYTPSFTSFSGGIYETELVRSVIHAKAKHSAKLTPHIIGNAYKNFENVLKHKPNEFQSTYDFLYRLRTLLEVDTYAFIIPIFADDGLSVTGLYPLQSQSVSIMEHRGITYLRYRFANGKTAAIEYDRVGVLTKMNYANEFLGDGNGVLHNTMSLLDLQNQGIQDAIKQSAKIRFMARVGQNLRPEDLEKERNQFTKQNLSNDNNTGVMMFDNKYIDVKQIQSDPFTADEKQIQFIEESVFSYFGINKDILQNKFNEDTWNAFYEGEVETFAIQLSQAITNMLFTPKERAFGNSVHFSANRLQYASNKTKLEVSRALFDRGIFGSDDVAEIWNLPITGDNRKYIRKEYAEMVNINDDTITQVEVDKEIDKEVDKVLEGEDDNGDN